MCKAPPCRAGSFDKFEPCAEGAEASAEDRRTREFDEATSARDVFTPRHINQPLLEITRS